MCCNRIISDQVFEIISLLITFWNCIILAIRDPLAPDPAWSVDLNHFFLAFYTLEMAMKICALGLIFKRNSYFRDPMNVLDFVVVVTGYISLSPSLTNINLRALRTFRVLRTLKTISSIKALNTIVKTFLNALPLLMNTLFILFFVLLVFAIAGLQLFSGKLKRRCFDPVTGRLFLDEHGNDMICGSKSCPSGFACGKMTYNPDNELSNFDTIANSIVVVFQIITLEGWSTVLYETMEAVTPASVIYFLLLVVTGNYFLLNIALAAIKIIFSNHNRETEEKRRLNYEEKRNITLQYAKEELLQKMRDYREDRSKVSLKYKVQPDGQLLEHTTAKKGIFSQISQTLLSKTAWKKIFGKIKCCRPKRRNLNAEVPSGRELTGEGIITDNQSNLLTPTPLMRRSKVLPLRDTESPMQIISDSANVTNDNVQFQSSARKSQRESRFKLGMQIPKVKFMETESESPLLAQEKQSARNESKGSFPQIFVSESNDAQPSQDDVRPSQDDVRPSQDDVPEEKQNDELPVQVIEVTNKAKENPFFEIAGITKPALSNKNIQLNNFLQESAEETMEKTQGEDYKKLYKLDKETTLPETALTNIEIHQEENEVSPRLEESLKNLSKPNVNENDKQNVNEHEKPIIEENDKPNIDETYRQNVDENDKLNIDESDKPNINENDKPNIDENENPASPRQEVPFVQTLRSNKRFMTHRLSVQRKSISGFLNAIRAPAADQPAASASSKPVWKRRYEEQDYDAEDLVDLNELTYEIDIRHLKAVPNRKEQYNSSSFDSVLPKNFQRQRETLEKKELNEIHRTRPKMYYPLIDTIHAAKAVREDTNRLLAGKTISEVPIRKKQTLPQRQSKHEHSKKLPMKNDPSTEKVPKKAASNEEQEPGQIAVDVRQFKEVGDQRRAGVLQRFHESHKEMLEELSHRVEIRKKIHLDEDGDDEGSSIGKQRKGEHRTSSHRDPEQKTTLLYGKEPELTLQEAKEKMKEPVDPEEQKNYTNELEMYNFKGEYMKIRVSLSGVVTCC